MPASFDARKLIGSSGISAMSDSTVVWRASVSLCLLRYSVSSGFRVAPSSAAGRSGVAEPFLRKSAMNVCGSAGSSASAALSAASMRASTPCLAAYASASSTDILIARVRRVRRLLAVPCAQALGEGSVGRRGIAAKSLSSSWFTGDRCSTGEHVRRCERDAFSDDDRGRRRSRCRARRISPWPCRAYAAPPSSWCSCLAASCRPIRVLLFKRRDGPLAGRPTAGSSRALLEWLATVDGRPASPRSHRGRRLLCGRRPPLDGVGDSRLLMACDFDAEAFGSADVASAAAAAAAGGGCGQR